MICSEPGPGFRRYISLSWTKTRARRDRANGKPPDPRLNGDDENPSPQRDTLIDNVRRTDILVPPSSTLVQMLFLDWDVQSKRFLGLNLGSYADYFLWLDRAVLLSTSVPFEASDAEDKAIVGVGEMLTKLMLDFMEHNATYPLSPLLPVSWFVSFELELSAYPICVASAFICSYEIHITCSER